MVYEMSNWQLSIFLGLSVAVQEVNLVWFDLPILERSSACSSIFVSGARIAGPIGTGKVPFDAPERRADDGAIYGAIGATWCVLPIGPPNLSRIRPLVWPAALTKDFCKSLRDRTWHVPRVTNCSARARARNLEGPASNQSSSFKHSIELNSNALWSIPRDGHL